MALPLTLMALLEAPELSAEVQLVAGALRELLDDAPGPGLHSFRQALAAERAALAGRLTSKAWVLLGMTGTRRDGVVVGLPNGVQAAKGGPLRPVPWEVEFPARPGGRKPATLIEVATLADAVAEVDRRWPMPAWWTSLEQLDEAGLYAELTGAGCR